jgi:hypothetical protein
LRRYRQHIVADIGESPRYLSSPNLAVTDRFAVRLVRLLSLLSLSANPGDIRTHMSSGSESKYEHLAHWAIPYVWPIDQDFEDELEGIPPGYYVWRALAEGALCRPSERFRSATHAVVLLDAPDSYLEQFPEWEENVTRVLCQLTGLDDTRVMKRSIRSGAQGLSLCIFMGAQTDLDIAPGRWADLVDEGESQSAGNANTRWNTVADLVAPIKGVEVDAVRKDATTFRRDIRPLKLWNDYITFATASGLDAARNGEMID